MARPFRFRLERLLEVRRLREDLAGRELALARRAAEEQEALVRGLAGEAEAQKAARRGLQGRGELDLSRIRRHGDYQAAVEGRLETATRRLEELTRAEAARRRALVEARKGVKVLDRFRERRLLEHARGESRREQKELDEAARGSAPGTT